MTFTLSRPNYLWTLFIHWCTTTSLPFSDFPAVFPNCLIQYLFYNVSLSKALRTVGDLWDCLSNIADLTGVKASNHNIDQRSR